MAIVKDAVKADTKSKSAKGPDNSSHSKDLLIQLYKDMILYRRFEERVHVAYTTRRKFAGFCHLHIGQEAVAAGVQHALRPMDYVIGAYRSHTQAIAKGITPNEVMAELFGKATGCVHGKGGSMHMFSKDKRFLGGHGIVGGQVPLAAGVGFAIKYRAEQDICVCYVGDAATNQGQFFEALNMIATWNLPVLVIIENNRYGMGTDIHRTTSIDHLWKRALGFDMAHSQVDGSNVLTIYDAVKATGDEMRKKNHPHLMEIMTYRYRGHSVSDPGAYRTKEEVAEYQAKDPMLMHGKFLVASKLATEDDLLKWDEEAKKIAADAEDFADQSPPPGEEEIWRDVYAD
jgi:pyruvate dehydrogenase E1 component alpha subunit